ncbi:MAG: PBSX family phage terminase large subunit [Ruminiclostridium sp.]|jgi:phage terminase large subunit|nr:PBSX family phage terminase large subunit [Ruminiclostridium sp.]
MPNEKNLEPYKIRSTSEAREKGRAGGKASGVSRRRKRSLKECADYYLSLPPADRRRWNKIARQGVDPEDIDNQMAMIIGLAEQATRGDAQAAKVVIDLLGDQEEKPADTGPFELPARLIAPPFFPVHLDVLDREHLEYVEKGGRGSTKSSFISLEIVGLLKNNPQMHALCVRKIGNTLRDSVYAQIQWAIEELGLSEEFSGTKSPLEITYKPTGQKIYFRGADDPIKLKSIKPTFGHIGILWFEELDQFAGDEECRNIQQSVVRGGDEAYIFKSFNPPKAKNNWVNKYCDQPKENRLVTHSDYRAVPAQWLGKPFLEEAEYLKEINPTAYEHEYLGIPNGNGGMVFENVVAETITEEQINTFDRILNGVDWGYYPDPWAFNRMHYDAARRTLYIFDELTAYKKGNRETADLLLERGLTRADRITADSAEPKSVADYQNYGLHCYGALKGPGSVDYSMKWLQSLVKIVIDPARCPDTYEEFTEYEYERTRDGEIISGYPDRDNHHIDAVRYATEAIWKRRGK